MPAGIADALAGVDRDGRRPAATCSGSTGTTRWTATAPGASTLPEHVVLPPSLTGVESPIIVVLGDRSR